MSPRPAADGAWDPRRRMGGAGCGTECADADSHCRPPQRPVPWPEDVLRSDRELISQVVVRAFLLPSCCWIAISGIIGTMAKSPLGCIINAGTASDLSRDLVTEAKRSGAPPDHTLPETWRKTPCCDY